MFNLMSIQMFRQLVNKVFTNPFPVEHMPEELGEALEAAGRGEITLNPPTDQNRVEPRFRGRVAYDKGKCIGCKMCIKVCPANAITFVEEEKKIQVHSDRCCFCAQCTEICPVNCLAMSNDFAFASYERSEEEVIVKDSGQFKVKLGNVVKVLEEQPAAVTDDLVTEEEPVKEEVKPKYEIDPDKCIGCTKCARLCPVDAIEGKVKEPHVIDKDKCVACGQCAEGCPVGAIFLEDPNKPQETAVEVKEPEKPEEKEQPAEKTTAETPAEPEPAEEKEVVKEVPEKAAEEKAEKPAPKKPRATTRKRAPRKKKEEPETESE